VQLIFRRNSHDPNSKSSEIFGVLACVTLWHNKKQVTVLDTNAFVRDIFEVNYNTYKPIC